MVDSFFIVQKKRFDIDVTISCHTNNENEPDFTIDSIVGAKIKELEFPSVSKPGYYFDGWYYSPDFSGEEVTSDSHAGYFLNNIYAKWTEMGTNCNEFEVETTTENQFVGFYSITKSPTSKYIFIDWGDGTCEILSENASKLEHKYATSGTYSLKINDSITKIQFGASDYYSVGEGIKEWVSIGSKYSKPTSLSQYEFSGIGFRNLSFLDWFTSVTSIPSYCFSRAKITSLQGMPSRITSLNTYCFQYCENLTSLEGLGTGLNTIPSHCFYYSGITSLTGLHSGITSLQTYAFAYCQYLTDISGLANGAFTSLPDYCFYHCIGFASTATLPAKITSLGANCFRNCSSLSNLSGIGSSVSLGTYCFAYCSSLTNISTLPNRSSLPNYCFYYCTGITSLSLGSTYTSLGTGCFASCTSLQTVDLSQSGLNSLPSSCFTSCTSLRSVTFKNPMAGSIGANCFQNCYNANFTSVEIPEGVTSLGDYCFNYCYNLKSVTIPSTCTSLGSYCFSGCRQIKDLYCLRYSAPSTSIRTFGYSTSNNSNTYTGYTTRGSNTLWVNSGASGYDSGLWLSPLQTASQCGFTKQEIEGIELYNGELEYIYSPLYARMDTGIQPTLNTKMVAEIALGQCAGNNYFGMSQQQTGSDSNDFRFFISQETVYWDYSSERWSSSLANSGLDQGLVNFHTIECSNGSIVIDGTTKTSTTATGSVGTGHIYIGNDSSSGTQFISEFKIKSFKVYENDVLVGDFVPWYLDGVVGMWDNVTQTFFREKNSEYPFSPGPNTGRLMDSTISNYVQNGLCVLYDGYENSGLLSHDLSASYWYNHATKNNDGLMKSDVKWEKDSFLNSSTGKPCEIQISDLYSVMNTSRTFTIEFLVKPSRTSTRESFFSNYHGYTNTIGIEHNSGSVSDGKIRAWYAGDPDMYSNSTVLSGETAFVTITSTPSEHKIYKNGILDSTNTQSIGTYSSTDKYVVGGEHQRAIMAFYGNYYLFHLYNRVLSDSEIRTNYIVAKDKYIPKEFLIRGIKLEIDANSSGTIIQFGSLVFIDENSSEFDYPESSSISCTYENCQASTSNETFQHALNNSTTSGKCCLINVTVPCNITADFGNKIIDLLKYNRWRWYTANDTAANPGRNMTSFKLWVSQDMEEWILVDTATNISPPAANYALAYTGNVSLPNLPYDARIEYLESTGTQYINTDIEFESNVGYEINAEFTTSIAEGIYSVLIGIQDENYGWWYSTWTDGITVYNDINESSSIPFGTNKIISAKLNFLNNLSSIISDNLGNHNETAIVDNIVSRNVQLCLFASGTNIGPMDFSECRIYDCKISKENTLVRDFIPVRVGTVGYMYDKVSGRLFGNSGTGSFVLGPDV